jgi:Phosphoribosyl transferase/TRSP domain C terminus to PRTase_2
MTDTLTRTHIRLPSGELRLDVHPDPNWRLDDLLTFGVRRNPKRGYLLVSRVLGKHIPVSPLTIQAAQRALAAQLPADLPGPVLVIGLAETATALGEGVAREWAASAGRSDTGRSDLTYLHTTRYVQEGTLALGFQEPHSHASGHLLYRPVGSESQKHFHQARTLVLIDDELSTGTTLANLARAYLQLNPALEQVWMVSLTDLCPRHAELQASIGRAVHSVSLLRGHLDFTPDAAYQPPDLPAVTGDGADKTALLAGTSARNGQDASASPLLAAALEQLAQMPAGHRVLILGTGEFQYLPYLLALRLQQRRPDLQVLHSATTRSPVTIWGGISSALEFGDNYQDGIANFVYNVQPNAYGSVWVGYEGQAIPDQKLLDALNAAALPLA